MARPGYFVSVQWDLQNDIRLDSGGVTVKYRGKPLLISPLHKPQPGVSVANLSLQADHATTVTLSARTPTPVPKGKFALDVLPADILYKIALLLSRIERSRLDKVCRHIHSSMDLIALEAARLVALPPSSEERAAVKANIYGKYPALCRDFTSAHRMLAQFLDSSLITKEDPAGILGDACWVGDGETVKFILDTCPPELIDSEYAFSTACQQGHAHIARLFLHRLPVDPAPNGRWPAHLTKAITEASAAGHLPIVQLIMGETTLRLDIEGSWMPRPLWSAAKNGHVQIVEYVLAKGHPPTIGKNVISANNNTLPIIRALHSHGWNPREFNDTAMIEACTKNLIPIVRELVSYGVPVTPPSINTAAENGDMPLLEALLSFGAKTPENLDTALEKATWSQKHQTCLWLLQQGADWVRSSRNALITRRENSSTTIEFVFTHSPTPIPFAWTVEALDMALRFKYRAWIKPLFTMAPSPGLSLTEHGEDAMVKMMKWWDPSGVYIGRVLVELGVSIENSVAKVEAEEGYSGSEEKKAEFLRLLVCSEEEVERAAKKRADDWIRGKQEMRRQQLETQGYATR